MNNERYYHAAFITNGIHVILSVPEDRLFCIASVAEAFCLCMPLESLYNKALQKRPCLFVRIPV